MLMTSHTEIPDEIVEKAARAIYTCEIGHPNLWEKLPVDERRDYYNRARAALSAVAPMLRAQGMREAALIIEHKELTVITYSHAASEARAAILARAADIEGGKG